MKDSERIRANYYYISTVPVQCAVQAEQWSVYVPTDDKGKLSHCTGRPEPGIALERENIRVMVADQ